MRTYYSYVQLLVVRVFKSHDMKLLLSIDYCNSARL